MKTFDWSEQYDVKVARFNEQHKHLFEIIKELYSAMNDKDDRLALAAIINNLIKYSKEHFAEEENALFGAQYPNYEEHKKQHDRFMQQIQQFAADFNSGRYLLHFDILMFLKNWVLKHIMISDKHYGEFLNDKGVY